MTAPSLQTKIAAVAVVIALGALAAYTLFSGPTVVPLNGPLKAAPTLTIPQGEPGEGGESGD